MSTVMRGVNAKILINGKVVAHVGDVTVTYDANKNKFSEVVVTDPQSFTVEGYRMASSCEHEMESYVGLNETFRYCKKCPYKER